ncbi:hypothetical protein [Bradyrhizobium commune]|uniref:Uncharacterized protein n=1 Tax=Bradyrhizobium commune TaxID=83627 RepID=A0A7S9D0C6_9BRAD|nr:hypothetical protein [Bradyrhizobium commune]QPF88837.1 hypothetical protein IC761_20145 [Bradyrhizobium commune]
MLATLNSRQIVDEIVKDTMKDNDPHDAVQISPDVVRASRASSDAPSLAPEIAPRADSKLHVAPEVPAAAPSVDTAVRAVASDMPGREKRSAVSKWLRGAFVTMLFAGGSAAATIAWERHGDTALQMLAEWTPSLTSLMPQTSPATPAVTAEAAPQVAPDQTTAPSAASPAAQDAAAAPPATPSDTAPSLQSMSRDLAAMSQQIEQLKANIAELKAAQEQIARETVKTPAPKPVAAVAPVDPRARVSALPPRPVVAPVRKPKPVTTPAYPQTYAAPMPIAPLPPPSQAVAVPPPPSVATQAVADDDGPVVRPPMPVH